MFIRYASAVTSGTFVTLGLFYVMQTLIDMDPFNPIEPRPRNTLDWLSVIDEEPVRPLDESKPKKIDDPVPPPPPLPRSKVPVEATGVHVPAPPPPPGPTTQLTGFASDNPLVAMLRVEPAYPSAAAQRGLEGYVIVQFDVNPDGTVSNVSVVESSSALFERAAVSAALRFRFKARVVDGIAVASHGIQNLFRFTIKED